jgi:eukaryotic-like serine/threonine-protein kinase
MGKVYRAFDARLERAVAIKVLEAVPDSEPGLSGTAPGDGGDAIAAVLREARAAAAILHPNATSIFDADRIGDTSFIVMELVPGTSLRRFVGDPALPVPTRVRWLCDVAGALAAAHRAGVVHRDVKPENILVRDDGLVKVLDFGIARRPRPAVTPPPAPSSPTLTPPDQAGSFMSTLTSAGSLLGTPAYMAPEQIRGEDLDGRADQFSWGVLAYELLAGRLPWGTAADPLTLLAAVLTDAPVRFPDGAGVPPAVVEALLRALSKSPADRFPSMNDAAAALAPHAGARRPLRRSPPAPSSSGRPASTPPPSSIPAVHAAVELGFSGQPVPAAIPTPTPPRPVDASDPLTRTQPSGPLPFPPGRPPGPPPVEPSHAPTPVPRLRAPDFSASVDVDAHLALLPPDATCKGVFFADLFRLGASTLPAAELFHLAGLPEQRYTAFRDYPAADYLRLAVAAALAVHPTLPLGEALRRIGQTAFRTASSSLVGKTLFGVYGKDVEPLLLTAPRAFRVFRNFGDATIEKTGPKAFRLTVRALPLFLETYEVGVVEGVLQHCEVEGRVRILVEALDRATLELELL